VGSTAEDIGAPVTLAEPHLLLAIMLFSPYCCASDAAQ